MVLFHCQEFVILNYCKKLALHHFLYRIVVKVICNINCHWAWIVFLLSCVAMHLNKSWCAGNCTRCAERKKQTNNKIDTFIFRFLDFTLCYSRAQKSMVLLHEFVLLISLNIIFFVCIRTSNFTLQFDINDAHMRTYFFFVEYIFANRLKISHTNHKNLEGIMVMDVIWQVES